MLEILGFDGVDLVTPRLAGGLAGVAAPGTMKRRCDADGLPMRGNIAVQRHLGATNALVIDRYARQSSHANGAMISFMRSTTASDPS